MRTPTAIAALLRLVNHIRLAIAESDLHWMEHHAPEAIARQRARVLALRTRFEFQPPTTQSIARKACREKRVMLAQKIRGATARVYAMVPVGEARTGAEWRGA